MQSLDFQLGLLAYQVRGAQAFAGHEVPNLINQAGLGPLRLAQVLFEHCRWLQGQDALPAQIEVLELGMGPGLHALQVLDRFTLLSQQNGVDWADRLTFYATDGSLAMLRDARDRGVFSRHGNRVVLGQADVAQPGTVTRLDDGQTLDLTGRLLAIFHTYTLSILPAHVLQFQPPAADSLQPGQWAVVAAQTVLQHPEDLSIFTQMSVQQIQAAVASQDPRQLQALVPLYPLIDLQLGMAPVDLAELDLPEQAEALAQRLLEARGPDQALEPTWVFHSYGAMRALQAMLQTIREQGFVFYRDYGPATPQAAGQYQMYQHYGPSIGTGINQLQIDAFVAGLQPDGRPVRALQPAEEGEAPIKTRLILRQPAPATEAAFGQLFAPVAFAALDQSVGAARQAYWQQEADAVERFRAALQLEPEHWALLAESGDAALRWVGPAGERAWDLAGVLLQESLRINPWYNSDAWNSLGDLQWTRGDFDGAEAAYARAVANNPEQARGYLNLASARLERGDPVRALELAANALARDGSGAGLQQAQDLHAQALAQLTQRRERTAFLRSRRQAGSPH